MRRLFVIVVFLYLTTAIVLVLLDRKTLNEIEIMAFPRQASYYIDDLEETLTFTLFFSSSDTFLCDKTQIANVNLANENSTVALQVNDLQVGIEAIEFEERFYVPVDFVFVVDLVQAMGLNIDLQSALLTLSYDNGAVLSIGVGDIGLVFPKERTDSPISLTRMYGVFDEDTLQMSGFVLGIDAEWGLDVTVTNIGIGPGTTTIDFENVIPLAQDLRTMNEIEEYAISIGFIGGEPLQYQDEILLYIPLLLTEDALPMRRFPVFVSCLAFGVTYELEIDDFLFRSFAAYDPEYDQYAEKTVYRY